MLRLASDADVHGDILRGRRRRKPELDLVRVQGAVSEGTPDPAVLDWAAANGRVLVTNDRSTMVGFAFRRLTDGHPFHGLLATTSVQSIGNAIDDTLLIAECLSEEEMQAQAANFLPLR